MMADLMKKFEHWNVRILRRGDRYGLNDCLTHEEDDPIIEFYDTNRTDDEEWKRGHFVARYYVETLFDDEWDLQNQGLQLDGGVENWYVTPQAMARILCWLRQEFPQFKPTAKQLSDWNFLRGRTSLEGDRIQNALARALIRKMREDGLGKCYLGRYNRNDHDPYGLQEYRHGMIYNFQYNFVIPEFDPAIHEWLLEYQRHGRLSILEKIGDRIHELNGYPIFWS